MNCVTTGKNGNWWIFEQHDFEKPLVAICYVGNSSRGAAELLRKAGFEKVYSLDGGMTLWQTQYPELVE